MLSPGKLLKDDILTIDRAYIDYEKFAELTDRGVIYVTKMNKNMKYKLHEDMILQDPDGLMQVRLQKVTLTKELPDRTIMHRARIITYPDIKKKKLISLLTNDFEMDALEIIEIYRKRWAIELLFKQLKQNVPLRYLYGESKNAIMIQIWVTLIANLLLTIKQRTLNRSWSFLGMATMVHVLLRGVLLGGKYKYSTWDSGIATPQPGTLECVLGYNYANLTDNHAGIRGGRQNDAFVT